MRFVQFLFFRHTLGDRGKREEGAVLYSPLFLKYKLDIGKSGKSISPCHSICS